MILKTTPVLQKFSFSVASDETMQQQSTLQQQQLDQAVEQRSFNENRRRLVHLCQWLPKAERCSSVDNQYSSWCR